MPPLFIENELQRSWQNYFIDRGLSEKICNDYSEYSRKLISNRVPVIFEFEHLSLLLGITSDFLARMIHSPESFYRQFTIPKRNGSRRTISAPHQSLLLVQRWILKEILEKVPVNETAHGFIKNRSIKTNAQTHLNGSALLKMDLSNFFPSISINWVINIFKDLGYADNVSFYLASLCCLDGGLTQGAPTSPAISNVALRSLDNRLARLSKKCKLNFSRYADDLTFSGADIHYSFSTLICEIVESYGLKINHEKTRLKIKKIGRAHV